ncbi:MAG: HIT domain-containing protein [Armatimonadota bacterium]
MWAPWRIGYVAGDRPSGCVFCRKVEANDDEAEFVLFRGKHTAVVLNTYPYNSGHLMVVPYAHVAELWDLTSEAHEELWELTRLAAQALRQALSPQGMNIGMNIGQAAGAGISDHLHMHIVPRWQGDTNYMTSVAETRVVPQSLEDSFRQLRPVIAELAAASSKRP